MSDSLTDLPKPLPWGGDFALSGLTQISLPVQNLARAVRFYHDRLRLPLQRIGERVALFDANGVRLALTLVAEGQTSSGPTGSAAAGVAESVLYFRVPDIRIAYQALVERGVRFSQPPRPLARTASGEIWVVFFRDSENNLLALTSEPSGSGE